jgi:hypothetical protein
MTRFVALFPVLALCACAYPNQSGDSPGARPRTATETRAPQDPARTTNMPFRAGLGTVESVTRLEPNGAAAAGGSAGGAPSDRAAYRLDLRMDDGTQLTVLQDSPRFSPGDRVRLTEDGRAIGL